MDYKTLFLKTKDLSLLLVEDYEPLRTDMEELFRDLFKEVVVAENGKEALELYEKFDKKFDIIITDIQMPIMNGIELCQEILSVNPNQQIIVLSAYTESEYLLKLINLGIAQFITKPIEYSELTDTLSRVIRKIKNIGRQPSDDVLVHLTETYTWNKDSCILKEDNNIIDLTRNEALVMGLFVDKSEQICSNNDILNIFYVNNIDFNTTSIRNLVFKLRKKLPSRVITSVYGMGYMLTPIDDLV